MASAARDVSVSAGPVSTICSEPPPPVSVSRERTACPAPLEFLPIFTLSQTQRGGLGWGRGVVMVGEEGGWEQQRDAAHRRGRTTEEAGKIHLFIPPLSVKSPAHFLNSALRRSPVFLLLLRRHARLSLCPSLTRTPNPPPRFTPHSFLNPKSLLSSLLDLFQLFSPYLSVTRLLPLLLAVYHIWTCHLSL